MGKGGGNNPGKARDDDGHLDNDLSYDNMSPPMSPGAGSPLTYSPQIPMIPIPKPDELNLLSAGHNSVTEFHGVAGWPNQQQAVPTVIMWGHGGNTVAVEGSWDNWTTRTPMHRSGRDFTIVKLLLPGVYQYKFIVDDEWKYAPDQPAMYDEMHNVNNVLEVQEYIPENLDSLASFEPPSSPPSSYNQPFPAAEDYAKEPPALPQHLQLTLLNVPPSMEAPAALPRPQHVILNHLYVEKSKAVWGAKVLGTTHRYKNKYVTLVMYKPAIKKMRRTPSQAAAGGPPHGGGSMPQAVPHQHLS